MTETRASTTDRRAVRRTTAEAPRGARCNHQQILPLVQTLALPIYWLIGRQLGLGPIAATAFMLVAPFAMHSAVLSCGFVVSWFNQAGRPGPRPGRRRDWLLAFVVEAGMSIRQFYWLMPFRAGFREPPPVPPAQPLAVILVHGYGCNRGLWLPAARWFAMHGYRVSAINLAPMHCRIDDYAPQIAAEIARRAARIRHWPPSLPSAPRTSAPTSHASDSVKTPDRCAMAPPGWRDSARGKAFRAR